MSEADTHRHGAGDGGAHGTEGGQDRSHGHDRGPSGGPRLVKDPVCGMMVSADGPLRSTFEGETFVFCNPGCLDRFEREPRRFVGLRVPPARPDADAAPAAPAAREGDGDGEPAWTCPMHPEIVRDRAGTCPLCGMALEPLTVTLEAPENPELADMRRRFLVSAALTAPLMAIAMVPMLPLAWAHHLMASTARPWIEVALATPVVLWGGWPFLVRAVASVRRRSPNMFTLIGLGVAVAYGYSLVATALPDIFPPSFRDARGRVGVYFEAAAAIVTLVLLGQVLELGARSRTGSAIRGLLGLTPRVARRLRSDGADEEDVALADVNPGDRLRVRPGERVPVDGTILEGHGAIDESMVTGEPIPVEKEPGAPVIGGTMNGSGSFVMRADRVGTRTLLAQIVRLVGEAQRSRAPIQRMADVVAGIFVPAVVATAVVTFAAWAALGPEPRMAHALVNAIAVLIIACPCALGLATPMSIMVATGQAATLGVLFRNAEAIEILGKVDTLVVDKTGTLTVGKPRLVSVVPLLSSGGFDASELVRMAATLERGSEHPLAAAIVAGAAERGVRLPPTRTEPGAASGSFTSVTGMGVKGMVEGRTVALGNPELLAAMGTTPAPALEERAESLRNDGQTVMFVVVDGRMAGLLGVADPIRPTTVEAIRQLRADGLRIVMLTGDNRTTAQAVGRILGIDDVVAGALPAQKMEAIRRLRADGHVVAMAGDGVNDAPALALADVGIAMGTGTDVAMASAGVTLVQPDLRGIVRARRLSRATMANIRQNLFFAFVYNAIGVPLAAGVLYPVLGLLLTPTLAAAAMAFSSVSVIGNALRLRRARVQA